MLGDQKSIYYITGGDEKTLRNSPLLEAYRKKEIEVLIMDDDFDEVVVPTLGKYKDLDLKSINRADAGEDLKDKADKKKEKELEPLIEKIKGALGERVKDVRVSVRLSDSPSCIVVDDADPTLQMQSLLKAMGQQEIPDTKPILEINPEHEILTKAQSIENDDLINDISFLLLDQALLVEGVEIKEPAEFVKRLNRVLERSL
jgi:molecular chaperone HtpG